MIVDIKNLDDGLKGADFFIDTNVLYWYSYSKYDFFNGPARKQAKPYLDFVERLSDDNVSLFTSIFHIYEPRFSMSVCGCVWL